jgi:hypothetical protein
MTTESQVISPIYEMLFNESDIANVVQINDTQLTATFLGGRTFKVTVEESNGRHERGTFIILTGKCTESIRRINFAVGMSAPVNVIGEYEGRYCLMRGESTVWITKDEFHESMRLGGIIKIS